MIKITTNKSKIDVAFVHHYLSEISYWAKGIPLALVEKSIQNSMCFSVFKNEKQIGFARVVTDYTTFAYLADVFIDENHRGHGYSKELMAVIMNHQELQGIRRWMLMTNNAHGLYEQFNFSKMKKPENAMEIRLEKPYM